MKKLTILLALTLLAACSPKKSSVKATVATLSGVPVGTQCTMSTTSSSNVGTIYDGQNSMNFENQVKALLSATVSPYEVGSISSSPADQTGVRFSGVIKLDASGNVLGAQSNLTITVYDSNAVYSGGSVKPITMQFSQNNSAGAVITGQFNTSTGEGLLSLKDNYGEIKFQGRVDAQNFSGTVSFQNTVSVLGGTPSSGTLGQFSIQRCGILQ